MTTTGFTDPAVLVIAGIRHVAAAAGLYLAAVLVVGAVGRLARLRSLVRAADVVTIPALRRLLDAALGLSVAASALVPTTAASAATPDRTAVTMVRLPDERGRPSPTTSPRPSPPPAAPAPPPAQWTVAPGDHFWLIAQRRLADALARAPNDAEVDPYWRRLVEANRGRLADHDNPDLLFVGQVLDLPAP